MKKKQRIDKVHNPAVMLEVAKGFFNTGWIVAKGLREISSEEQVGKVAPAAINLIFSVEILLKYLHIQEGKEVPETHNLSCLFTGLSSSMQDKIKEQFEFFLKVENTDGIGIFMLSKQFGKKPLPTPNMRDLNTFLDLHKNSFIEWRYYFELRDTEYQIYSDFHSIRCLYKALSSQIPQMSNS